MFTPVTNGLRFVYPKLDLSLYDLSSKKDQNILLATAADKEINGNKEDAKFIYSRLGNNSEAQAHLKRIATDTALHLHLPQQLLNLATVAEEHGSVGTAFRVYSELLRQSLDDDVRTTASQRLAHEKFNGHVIHGR